MPTFSKYITSGGENDSSDNKFKPRIKGRSGQTTTLSANTKPGVPKVATKKKEEVKTPQTGEK